MSKLSNDTTVWITGASSGIGKALALALGVKGVKLIISSRREKELHRVKEACPFPENVEVLPLDLADSNSIPSKVSEVISSHGKIDILINNGGISQRDRAINTQIDVDRRLMEINYFGTVALSKEVLPHMLQAGDGHVVVISSVTGKISTPFRSSYAASKHALHGFFDAMRAEHHADNIKVSLICPGFIRTNISLNALTGDGTPQNKMDQAQANGMSPEECARKIIRAIETNREETYIGGLREIGGIYLKRFWPRMFSRVIRKSAVT